MRIWRHQVADILHSSIPVVYHLLGEFFRSTSFYHFMDLCLIGCFPIWLSVEAFSSPQERGLYRSSVVGKKRWVLNPGILRVPVRSIAVVITCHIGQTLFDDFQLFLLNQRHFLPSWLTGITTAPSTQGFAAPMLSHFHQLRNSFSAAVCFGPVSMTSWYFAAAVFMEHAKCVSHRCAVTSTSSKRFGCAPATVLPSGLSHKTRSSMIFILCGASLPSR